MSPKKIIAIILIFIAASAGWAFLGTITQARSYSYFYRLGKNVESLWGTPLVQPTPSFAVQIPGTKQVRWMMPSRNDIRVEIETDYRKKGLLWYSTYICRFESTYTISNTDLVMQKIRFHFSFPAKDATYDDFAMVINGQLSTAAVNTDLGINDLIELAPGKNAVFKIKYKTRGINSWRYRLDKHVGRVQNLNVIVNTDFDDVDFTQASLSPMSKKASDPMPLT